jgi:hypothetical protein
LQYSAAVCQFWCEIAMVLSDSLVLPLNVMDYAVDLEVNVRLLQSEYQQLMSDNGMSIGIAKLNFICFRVDQLFKLIMQ